MKLSGSILAIIIVIAILISSCGENRNSFCSNFSLPATPVNALTQKLLVVRINFEGDPNDSSYSGNPYTYTNFNSDNCTWAKKIFYNSTEGQLNHYFNSVSNNKFHLVPAKETHSNTATYQSQYDGIITVTLSGNHPNPGSSGYFHQKLVDALTLADNYIDFSSFDVSSDSIIHGSDLQIMFLVAGYESSTTPNYHGVWAHNSCLGGQEEVFAPTLDGVTLLGCDGNGYTRFGERHTDEGYDAPIGIIAHELVHALWDLPDLYDSDGSSSGIGAFGLMGMGSWGRESGEKSGETPVHPSAWTKINIGWITPTPPANGQTLSLFATENPNYNIAKVVIGANEHFLVENRSSLGYDKGLYLLNKTTFLGGIAIWHIDDNVADFAPNNDESLKRVDLEEANDAGLDSKLHNGKPTNLFWDSNQATFNNSTTPDSKNNAGGTTNIEITGITNRDTEMNATFSF